MDSECRLVLLRRGTCGGTRAWCSCVFRRSPLAGCLSPTGGTGASRETGVGSESHRLIEEVAARKLYSSLPLLSQLG
jgi:hypothetical protein